MQPAPSQPKMREPQHKRTIVATCKARCEKTLKAPLPLKGSAPLCLDLHLSSFSQLQQQCQSCILVSSFTPCTILSFCCPVAFRTIAASSQTLFATQCLLLQLTSVNHLFMLPTHKELQMLVPPLYVRLTSNAYFTYHYYFVSFIQY